MIPQFPEFRKLELSDRAEITQITKHFEPYSDFDFGSMWSWNFTNAMEVSILHGNFVVRFIDYISGEPFLTFIGSGNANDTARTLLEYSKQYLNINELRLIPRTVAGTLDHELFSVLEDTDNADYILSVERLAALDGPELSSKRRAVQQFNRLGTNAVFSEIHPMDPDTRKSILDLFSTWHSFKQDGGVVTEEHEYIALVRCLDAYANLDIVATGLTIEGKLEAFWMIGNLPNNFSISHFEKANTEQFQGIFPYFKQKTATFLLKRRVRFINLEQDLGIPGLKQSKQSYVPVHHLHKYRVQARL